MKKEFNKVSGAIGEFDACKYLEKKKYNVVEINVALYEYDQPLLGVQI